MVGTEYDRERYKKSAAKKVTPMKKSAPAKSAAKEEFSLDTLLAKVGGGDLALYKKVAAVIEKYSVDAGVKVEFLSFKYGEVSLRVASSKARLVRLDKEKLIALVNKKIAPNQCLSIRVTSVKG